MSELTDEQCDRIVDLTMAKLAAKHGIQASDLNPDIAAHRSLRRSIVRAAHAIGESELSALREKCAELEADLFAERALPKFRYKPYADTDAGLVKQVTELQNELAESSAKNAELQRDNLLLSQQCQMWKDESATANRILQRERDEADKQAPVFFGDDETITSWNRGSRRGGAVDVRIVSRPAGMCTTPLYALPPNLPALIEQAKADERINVAQEIQAACENGDLPDCCEDAADYVVRARKP